MSVLPVKQNIRPLIKANVQMANRAMDLNEIYFVSCDTEDWLYFEDKSGEYKVYNYYTFNRDMLLDLIEGKYAYDITSYFENDKVAYKFKTIKQY